MSRELQPAQSAESGAGAETNGARDGGMGGAFDPSSLGRAEALHDPALFDGIVSRRVMAYVIDAIILAVLGFIAWFVLSLATVISFGLLLPVQAVVLTLLPVAYATWTIGGPRHATYGMRITGVTVIGALDGRPPGYLQALVMVVCFYMSVALTTWLILLLAFFSNRRRTVHDWLAATLVVRREALPA